MNIIHIYTQIKDVSSDRFIHYIKTTTVNGYVTARLCNQSFREMPKKFKSFHEKSKMKG